MFGSQDPLQGSLDEGPSLLSPKCMSQVGRPSWGQGSSLGLLGVALFVVPLAVLAAAGALGPRVRSCPGQRGVVDAGRESGGP